MFNAGYVAIVIVELPSYSTGKYLSLTWPFEPALDHLSPFQLTLSFSLPLMIIEAGYCWNLSPLSVVIAGPKRDPDEFPIPQYAIDVERMSAVDVDMFYAEPFGVRECTFHMREISMKKREQQRDSAHHTRHNRRSRISSRDYQS